MSKFNENGYQKFYEKLGILFYSIAYADQSIHRYESNTLKDEIRKVWLPYESSKDEFGTDSAHYIFYSFDSLLEKGVSSEKAFQVFKSYFLENAQFINEELRNMILRTSSMIARSFYGINQEEQLLISKLRLLLEDKVSS